MSFAWTAVGVAIVGAATAITLGSISIVNQKKAARAQLEAQSMQAKVQGNQRIKLARKQASQQKSSFLSSGISLTGDGTTEAVISDTYDIATEDVSNIKKYGAVSGQNITANARAKMLSTYGQMASSVSSYASSALGSAGSISGGGGVDTGGDLSGMGDTYGGLDGMGSGSSFGTGFDGAKFDNYGSASASFGKVAY